MLFGLVLDTVGVGVHEILLHIKQVWSLFHLSKRGKLTPWPALEIRGPHESFADV